MIIILEPNQEIELRGSDSTNAIKQTVKIANSSGVGLFKVVFNNDGSFYEFYANGILTSQRLKMTGIESTQSPCAIHVSGHYCPICKKMID